MREYKFRGKRIDNGEWVYGHYFTSPLTDENSGATPDKGWYFLSGETRHCIEHDHVVFIVDPETVGQYTCLEDKNDKEIYKGDLVSTDLSRPYLIVEFRNGCFVFQCHDNGDDYYDIMTPIFEKVEKLKYHEIIGNIYENPELLNFKNGLDTGFQGS